MATIDERIEALTHSVELFSLGVTRLEGVVGALAESQQKTEDKLARAERIIARLSTIALDHEERLGSIEDGEES